MNDEELLIKLNEASKQIFETQDANIRKEADIFLDEVAASQKCIPSCILLFERGIMPYAPLVAKKLLISVLNSKASIPSDMRLQLSGYLLTYLKESVHRMPLFVTTALCQLFARIVKISWSYLDSEKGNSQEFQALLKSVVGLLTSSEGKTDVACHILSAVLVDFGIQEGVEGVAKLKRMAANFRDNFMKLIFEGCINLLRKLSGNRIFNTEDAQIYGLLLEVSLQTLSFDFIGSMYDETQDESNAIQIPGKWKDLFEEDSVVVMFFSLYKNVPHVHATKLLQNLVLLTSIRRTLFDCKSRSTHLEHLTKGVLDILSEPAKLRNPETFHEFCRLIARLKGTFQLTEIVKAGGYKEMVNSLVSFTMESLGIAEFSLNSVYYLLSFWSKMVTSTAYINNTEVHYLDDLCPNIVKAFISCRLNTCQQVVENGVDDELEDSGSVHQLMDILGVICRLGYRESFDNIVSIFDADVNKFTSVQLNSFESKLSKKRLTWLVYLIGGCILGKSTLSSNSDMDSIDGELVSRVLQLMKITDAQLVQVRPNDIDNDWQYLEHGYLYVLEHTRKQYISDQILRISEMYERLRKNMDIKNEEDLLVVYVHKIATNLKYLSTKEKVVDSSLNLFDELTLGFMASKKLLKMDEIQYMINNHNADLLSFNSENVTISSLKCRTNFYRSLTRIFACNLGEDFGAFETYMIPVGNTLKEIMNIFSNRNNSINQDQLKLAVISCCRDIRGIAFALSKKSHFTMLVQWMHPDIFGFIKGSLEIWGDRPEIVNPILKLLVEIACNRTSRLTFEMNTRYTIVLFREISKLIVDYGRKIIEMKNLSPNDFYKLKIKNIRNIFNIIKNVLQGSYLPYGVMDFYGDRCFNETFNLFIQLFFDIKDVFMDYPKLCKMYFSVLDTLARDQIVYISLLDENTFAEVLKSIHLGAQSLDSVIITNATNALDYIIDFIFRKVNPGVKTVSIDSETEGEACINALKSQPQILSQLLNTILYTLIFEDCKCQWSLSRPLFGIILLNPENFNVWKRDMINAQDSTKHQRLENAFDSLMDNIEKVLNSKNKDSFTTNVSIFRKSVVEILRDSNTPELDNRIDYDAEGM
uniref:Importin N-terminal domain-containing protein n=1 Tax=Rhabditophanes sp. KR3021 TaxID=114890 RepID=A0AC35UAL9_9BILA